MRYTSDTEWTKDPRNPYGENAVGVAMLGVIMFCCMTGLGVGAFIGAPGAGFFIGFATGIAAGILLVPSLMRDWQ